MQGPCRGCIGRSSASMKWKGQGCGRPPAGCAAQVDSAAVRLGELRDATSAASAEMAGAVVLAPASALNDKWARRLPDPVICGASGWMTVRQRAKQRGVELPLILSDHADWEELPSTLIETGAETVWVTPGAEEGLCHWCAVRGIDAQPLSIAGRADDGEGEGAPAPTEDVIES